MNHTIFAEARGTLSRSIERIASRRLLVIEHDKLPLADQAAVLRWLHEGAGLALRSVVFTDSKSLHGWFECPPPAQLDELRIMLVGGKKERPSGRMDIYLGGIGFDPSTFNPSQPYRVLGWQTRKDREPGRTLVLQK